MKWNKMSFLNQMLILILAGLVTVVGKTDHSVKPGGQLETRRLMVQADVEAGGSGTVNLRHSRRYVSGKDTPKGLYTGPYFSPGLVSNYTASVGETIRLNCKVYQVDGQSVAWVRSHDSTILSVDEIVFVSNPRFVVNQNKQRGEWTLIVKEIRKEDDGVYECQISTVNKLSHFINLKVLEPKVMIEGGPDVFTQQGSTVTLNCNITGTNIVPAVKWEFRGEEVLPGENIDLNIYKHKDTTVSQLTLHKVNKNRIGNYSCVPESIQPASINLHVILEDPNEELLTSSGNYANLSGLLVLMAIFLQQ